MSLRWKMPATSVEWKDKSGDYLTQVFGNEGPNSLLSELTREGYAAKLESGSYTKMS